MALEWQVLLTCIFHHLMTTFYQDSLGEGFDVGTFPWLFLLSNLERVNGYLIGTHGQVHDSTHCTVGLLALCESSFLSLIVAIFWMFVCREICLVLSLSLSHNPASAGPISLF